MFTSLPLGKCGLPCKAPLMTASGTNGGVVWCGGKWRSGGAWCGFYNKPSP